MTAEKRPPIRNQELLQAMEEMKSYLQIKNDTDLISTSLNLLKAYIELDKQGYTIGGYKKGLFEFEQRQIIIPKGGIHVDSND